mmetsp:Transcript_48518/g.149770  ORF Transcript_48518/g.149770 Transcript_48518/m.149770 type:complete len:257 (-) Transcript_48518:37-807(-)
MMTTMATAPPPSPPRLGHRRGERRTAVRMTTTTTMTTARASKASGSSSRKPRLAPPSRSTRPTRRCAAGAGARASPSSAKRTRRTLSATASRPRSRPRTATRGHTPTRPSSRPPARNLTSAAPSSSCVRATRNGCTPTKRRSRSTRAVHLCRLGIRKRSRGARRWRVGTCRPWIPRGAAPAATTTMQRWRLPAQTRRDSTSSACLRVPWCVGCRTPSRPVPLTLKPDRLPETPMSIRFAFLLSHTSDRHVPWNSLC